MNSKLIQRHFQTLLTLDRQHSRQLKALMTDDPFLKGSVIVFKRKCGKAVCCCKKGHPHESLVVSRWVKGKLKVVYAKPEERSKLFAERDRIRRFKKDKADLTGLQKRILKKLDRLVKLKTESYHPSPKPAKG